MLRGDLLLRETEELLVLCRSKNSKLFVDWIANNFKMTQSNMPQKGIINSAILVSNREQYKGYEKGLVSNLQECLEGKHIWMVIVWIRRYGVDRSELK